MSSFGDYLRKRRKEEGFGLRELARKCGVSPAYLSRMESGAEPNPPSEALITKLANVLRDDFDVMMNVAGRVAVDIRDYITATPNLADFLRRARDSGFQEKDFEFLKGFIRYTKDESDDADKD